MIGSYHVTLIIVSYLVLFTLINEIKYNHLVVVLAVVCPSPNCFNLVCFVESD